MSKSPTLALTPADEWKERKLGHSLALEYVRIAQPADSRAAVRYAHGVIVNSRMLAGASVRRHLALLGGQLQWLRGLPVGSAELRYEQ